MNLHYDIVLVFYSYAWKQSTTHLEDKNKQTRRGVCLQDRRLPFMLDKLLFDIL